MTERLDAVVVGGGVGGLAVAIRLAAAGRRVRVLERSDHLGGKLTVRVRDGFHFDIGPSLVTMPHLFDEVLSLSGTGLTQRVDMVRLDPAFHYQWPDGSHVTVSDDPAATSAALDAFSPGAGTGYERFLIRGRRIWEVSDRTFFAGPMDSPWRLASRLQSPTDLLAIDPLRTLHTAARATFTDPRLVQWAGRYATYSGSSPYRAPATLGCIPYLEAEYGAWYPRGGLGRLRDALVDAARDLGVELVTNAEVAAIEASRDAVTGVRLVSGERIATSIVIANVDAGHLYRDLLPDAKAQRRVTRAGRSSSGFVILAGVEGVTPNRHHHTVWFSPDDAAEFADLDAGRLHDDPTIYACVTSATDETQAPDGCESWFLLVNVPAGVSIDRDAYRDRVLERLAHRGLDLTNRCRFTETLTPQDLEAAYRSSGGAIYGTSSNGRRAAFLRPGNRGPRQGLYLVGGSSHPGGGLPLVLSSARIVADLVASDT